MEQLKPESILDEEDAILENVSECHQSYVPIRTNEESIEWGKDNTTQ